MYSFDFLNWTVVSLILNICFVVYHLFLPFESLICVIRPTAFVPRVLCQIARLNISPKKTLAMRVSLEI